MNNRQSQLNQLYVSALFAQLAYTNPKNIETKFMDIIKEHPNIFLEKDDLRYYNTNNSAEAYSWNIKHNSYIVFRGTKDFNDILIDMDIRRNELGLNEGFKVHNGFHKQFFSLEQELTQHLNKNTDSETIYFIGHSLGGGLASIAAAYYAYNYNNLKPIKLHTFGCPRVGNNDFVKYIENSNIDNWRVYNKNDIVSKIPLSTNFHHVNKNKLCLDNEKYKKEKYLFPRTFDLLKSINIKSPLFGHNINTYISKLSKMI